MKLSRQFLFFIILSTLAMASEKIPIPKESAGYSQKYVVPDPESGDDVICNQIYVVFTEDVTGSEQKSIIKKIDGALIGGIPAMDMYQIEIRNNGKSLKKVDGICAELQKNKKVIHAAPRKVPTGNIDKIEIENKKPVRRRGQLDMEPAERAAPQKEDEMVTTLTKHKTNLYECLKNASVNHGSIEYRITIDPKGEVTKSKILSSSFKDKNLKDCLAHQIRKWDDFPIYDKQYDRQLEFTFQF